MKKWLFKRAVKSIFFFILNPKYYTVAPAQDYFSLPSNFLFERVQAFERHSDIYESSWKKI